jgi:hypothetical protein
MILNNKIGKVKRKYAREEVGGVGKPVLDGVGLGVGLDAPGDLLFAPFHVRFEKFIQFL